MILKLIVDFRILRSLCRLLFVKDVVHDLFGVVYLNVLSVLLVLGWFSLLSLSLRLLDLLYLIILLLNWLFHGLLLWVQDMVFLYLFLGLFWIRQLGFLLLKNWLGLLFIGGLDVP